jgi:hypothetical protein
MEPLHADALPWRAKPRVAWLLQEDEADRRTRVGRRRRRRRRLTRTSRRTQAAEHPGRCLGQWHP